MHICLKTKQYKRKKEANALIVIGKQNLGIITLLLTCELRNPVYLETFKENSE